MLNGDAIFDFNLTKILNNHVKNKIGITFISGEITYQYGTVGVKNGKVVDFRRNILYGHYSQENPEIISHLTMPEFR